MIIALGIWWFLIGVGVLRFWIDDAATDPAVMPGGGPPVIVVVSVLWPLILVAMLGLLALMAVFGPGKRCKEHS